MTFPCSLTPMQYGVICMRQFLARRKPASSLKKADFVDEYRGKQIPQGKKSVTIRLTIGSNEKTLTSQEIENVANQVMKKLQKKMGAELRTQ